MTETIYCLIRKMWVAAIPEETVRQHVLAYMIQELGFPAPLISVEKAVRQLPHLLLMDRHRVPDRRVDILCYAKGKASNSTLYPLLAIECKAVPLTARVINQVVGYNHYIRARYIAVVNREKMRTGWYDPDKGEYAFVDYLPAYASLIQDL
jgi:hypothetical protein